MVCRVNANLQNFSTPQKPDTGKPGHDMVMTSGDVSATVSIPKPGKERFPVPLAELPPAVLRSGSIRASPPVPVRKIGKDGGGD